MPQWLFHRAHFSALHKGNFATRSFCSHRKSKNGRRRAGGNGIKDHREGNERSWLPLATPPTFRAKSDLRTAALLIYTRAWQIIHFCLARRSKKGLSWLKCIK